MRPSPITNAAARLVATSASVDVQNDFALGRAAAGACGEGGGAGERYVSVALPGTPSTLTCTCTRPPGACRER